VAFNEHHLRTVQCMFTRPPAASCRADALSFPLAT